jgi:hypothetical protein
MMLAEAACRTPRGTFADQQAGYGAVVEVGGDRLFGNYALFADAGIDLGSTGFVDSYDASAGSYESQVGADGTAGASRVPARPCRRPPVWCPSGPMRTSTVRSIHPMRSLTVGRLLICLDASSPARSQSVAPCASTWTSPSAEAKMPSLSTAPGSFPCRGLPALDLLRRRQRRLDDPAASARGRPSAARRRCAKGGREGSARGGASGTTLCARFAHLDAPVHETLATGASRSPAAISLAARA